MYNYFVQPHFIGWYSAMHMAGIENIYQTYF